MVAPTPGVLSPYIHDHLVGPTTKTRFYALYWFMIFCSSLSTMVATSFCLLFIFQQIILIAYSIVVSFQRVFWPSPLARRSFSSEALSRRLFCHCPLSACLSDFYHFMTISSKYE